MPQSKVFEAEESTGMADLLMTPFIGYALAEHALNDPNIRKFIHRTDLHFDLVINEEFFQDSISMFAHKFKAPQITICKTILTNNCLLLFNSNLIQF